MVDAKGAREKETDYLALAAFAHLRGFKILKAAESSRRRGEYLFTFDDPEDKWAALELEFANNECSRFDATLLKLKRLCKRNGVH